MKWFLLGLQACSAVIAVWSGAFWLKSAEVKVHWAGMSVLGGPAAATIEELNRQSLYNRTAARLAGVAAIMQGVILAAGLIG